MKNERLSLQYVPGLYLFLTLIFSPGLSEATPEYARETGALCTHCHIDASGGKQLTPPGEQFLRILISKGRISAPSAPNRFAHVIFGYIHMMAGILWFGTIMYVHILLKPAYASKGLPRGELRVGWISMVLVLISGMYLTITRMPSWASFYESSFGILLSIKVFLFMIMFSSAIVVTLYIGPKLRKQKSLVSNQVGGDCTVEGLCQFDGKDGRPAYTAYKGIIYDVSKSRLWRNGLHAAKHPAGNDLTEMLKNAPHGEDKVLGFPQVGRLMASLGELKQPFHVRLFYFFAYMNLVLVFVIPFIMALWKWW